MARLARYVIPGQSQHIIQRGNNREVIFTAEADYQFYATPLLRRYTSTAYLFTPASG
jgi:putative transposase